MTVTYTPRTLSAVALAARIADVASHVDDANATTVSISAQSYPALFLGETVRNAVHVHTDGAGFVALVEHMELTVTPRVVGRGDSNIYATGYVGLMELPVVVFAARDGVEVTG